jgi:ribosome recycling factor
MVIRINVPALTEERRKELVKKAKAEAEHAKVAIRQLRRDSNEKLKNEVKQHVAEDMIKDAEDKIQKMTDQFIVTVDKHLEQKEKEIMTV